MKCRRGRVDKRIVVVAAAHPSVDFADISSAMQGDFPLSLQATRSHSSPAAGRYT